MHAICIEASHERGLGHLFRALHLGKRLAASGTALVVLVNDDERAVAILKNAGFRHLAVPLKDVNRQWEAPIIREHGIRVWINDRHSTEASHAARVKAEGVMLATFDDHGTGAALSDLHFAALAFDGAGPPGKKVFRGLDYLILDPAIQNLRRLRSRPGSIVVSLGGSDTYGATVKVVRFLRKAGRSATVVLGPSFAHENELARELTRAFTVRRGVPSLAEEFSRHELAVTGGGITAFEAAAAGLPAIIVANEPFEVPAARHLEGLGCAVFAGFHAALREEPFAAELPLESMSRAGMAHVTGRGVDNVARALGAP